MNFVINAKELFDGEQLLKKRFVHIKKDKIVAIATTDEFPKEYTRIDAPFLMPGLIDMHVHLSVDEAHAVGNSQHALQTYVQLLLKNGITAVRDVGNSYAGYAAVEKTQPHPRIFKSGPLVDGTRPFWQGISDAIATKEDIIRAVKDRCAHGCTWLKIYFGLPPDLARVVITEAKKHHLHTAIHGGYMSPLEAGKLGITTIEHAHTLLTSFDTFPLTNTYEEYLHAVFNMCAAIPLDRADIKEAITMLQKNNVAVCPTLRVMDVVLHPQLGETELADAQSFDTSYSAKKTASAYASGTKGFAQLQAFVTRMHEAGITILAGSDTPNPGVVPGHALHHELQLLVEAGLSTVEALKTATSNAGTLLGEKIGRIAEGYAADLLILEKSPIRDITNSQSIKNVYLRGQKVV